MHKEIELYGLKRVVTPAPIEVSTLREMLSRYCDEGVSDVLFVIHPANREFFVTEFKAEVAGLRGDDTNPGQAYLLMRKNLRHPGDGVLPHSRTASTENA